ncbi:Folylpolyglutamate synthetase [Entophlyctis luteolus]|nr:Folylpolyglutamate synthetase [Entophlyctis luteolus]
MQLSVLPKSVLDQGHLQAILESLRKSGNSLNKISLPEVRGFLVRAGYQASDFNKLNVIHIAGTKGKGSTSAICDSILRQFRIIEKDGTERPVRTGLFSSPHLIQVRERIRINGSPISPDAFSNSFSRVWDAFGSEPKPGYFRFLFLMSLHAFTTPTAVDAAILETGIGGEYDCTNVVERPSVTGITSLGLDHQALLGSTVAQIAWHKAGIMKPGVACVVAPQPSEAIPVLEARAVERAIVPPSAPSLKYGKVGVNAIDDVRPRGSRLLHVVNDTDMESLKGIKLGLSGAHQYTNAAVAVAICKEWAEVYNRTHESKVVGGDEEIRKGLEMVRWPGRAQSINFEEFLDIDFHLDGAHTPENLNNLNMTIEKEAALKIPLSNKESWNRVRAGTVHEFATVHLCESLDDALEVVVSRSTESKNKSVSGNAQVLVTGSMHLIGALLTRCGAAVE